MTYSDARDTRIEPTNLPFPSRCLTLEYSVNLNPK